MVQNTCLIINSPQRVREQYIYIPYLLTHWLKVIKAGEGRDIILWHFQHATVQSEQSSRVLGKESPTLQRCRSWPLKSSSSILKGPKGCGQGTLSICCNILVVATVLSWLKHLDFNSLFTLVLRDFLFFVLCLARYLQLFFFTYFVKLLFLMCVYSWKEVYLDQSSSCWYQ